MRECILVFVLLSAFATSASACSCVSERVITAEERFQQTEFVFLGVLKWVKVIKSDGSFSLNRVGLFEVIEDLKGNAGDGAIVHYAEFNGANCGLNLEVNKTYEMFAWIDTDLGKVMTNECSGTREKAYRPGSSWSDYREIAGKQ